VTVTTRGGVRRGARWLKARIEVLVPVLGLPLFLLMAGQMDVTLNAFQTTLLWGAALAYAGLVLWSPMALPPKVERPVTRGRVARTAALVAVVVAGAVLLQAAAYRPSGESSDGGGSLLPVLLAIVLGTAGVLAEGTLPLDLFPVLRRRAVRRIAYVAVAAFFLMVVGQLWTELFGGVVAAIAQALGETPPESGEVAAYFDEYTPLGLFLTHLVSAGLEELLFRVGILTGVWALARRLGLGGKEAAWLGLLISAACFGLYHVTLSSLRGYFVQAPVMSILKSFGAGLADGLIYRYRGYTAAVLVHALGNWLFLMLFFGAGA
jgi:membrane protease YdiL (CAAX protease family)